MARVTVRRGLAAAAIAGAVIVVALKVYEAATGTNILVNQGSAFWIPVSERSAWLPRAMRLALHVPTPTAQLGKIEWRDLRPGFEVTELQALAGGREVDRILLARVDPRRYRFEVLNDPTGRTTLDGWRRALPDALLIMNGSYYAKSGQPATPVVIKGRAAGPADYKATQGAFRAARGAAGIIDLRDQDWRRALKGADAAMVSYPMLIAADGSLRAEESGWLANRTFLAEDTSGRILLGTTKTGFFSLARLADFLKRSPLDVKLALDLDGGPVACQSVAIGTFRRRTCGAWEIQVDKAGRAKMLPNLPWAAAPMPVAMAVFAEDSPPEAGGLK